MIGWTCNLCDGNKKYIQNFDCETAIRKADKNVRLISILRAQITKMCSRNNFDSSINNLSASDYLHLSVLLLPNITFNLHRRTENTLTLPSRWSYCIIILSYYLITATVV